MLRIGLTGGIAAGKSAVARRLAELGGVLVDADVLAREVVLPGTEGLAEIASTFGRSVLLPDGSLDRPALGRLVFDDSGARERLNAIIHPRVRLRAAGMIDAADADAIIVEDIPLLVETGQAARFHLVLVVDAPDDVRIERLVHQRGMQRHDAQQRLAAQAGRQERLREADAVVVNDRTLEDLLRAVEVLWHRRIVPFRDNLRAGTPAPPRSGDTPVPGVSGTVGLSRRVRAKLVETLPEGVEVVEVAAAGSNGDTVPATFRVSPEPGTVSRIVDAVAAAGFPPMSSNGTDAGEDGRFRHRSADPGVEVLIVVEAMPAPLSRGPRP